MLGKRDIDVKLGVLQGKVGEMPRTVFDFFKLMGVHQDDELGLCLDGLDVFAHT